MAVWLLLIAHVSALAYGLLGGVFLAFSDFIMRSLGQVAGHGGLEAMQIINREVFRIVFMVLFLGMAPVSLFMLIHGLVRGDGGGSLIIAAAGAVYLVGGFLVTVVFNVPLNETLAAMETEAPETTRFWQQTYLPRWTFWNTVRTMACALASALTVIGLIWIAQSTSA